MICCTSKTDMERFCRILERFASHLRSLGEETAAEAVETILKYIRQSGMCANGNACDILRS